MGSLSRSGQTPRENMFGASKSPLSVDEIIAEKLKRLREIFFSRLAGVKPALYAGIGTAFGGLNNGLLVLKRAPSRAKQGSLVIEDYAHRHAPQHLSESPFGGKCVQEDAVSQFGNDLGGNAAAEV